MLEFTLIGLLSGAGCGGIYLSSSDFRFSLSGLESELQRANLKCKRCLLCKPNENKVNISLQGAPTLKSNVLKCRRDGFLRENQLISVCLFLNFNAIISPDKFFPSQRERNKVSLLKFQSNWTRPVRRIQAVM